MKKRNPQDATVGRNIGKSRKVEHDHEERLKKLEAGIHGAWAVGARVLLLENQVVALQQIVKSIESQLAETATTILEPFDARLVKMTNQIDVLATKVEKLL